MIVRELRAIKVSNFFVYGLQGVCGFGNSITHKCPKNNFSIWALFDPEIKLQSSRFSQAPAKQEL